MSEYILYIGVWAIKGVLVGFYGSQFYVFETVCKITVVWKWKRKMNKKNFFFKPKRAVMTN